MSEKIIYDEFVNLHVHTTFSTFDGLGLPTDFAKEAKRLNQHSLAITDHGCVSGLIKHFEACKDLDINPIMGCECYFTLDHTKKEKNNYHMTILCKSDKGYSNLMQLMTKANVDGFYYRPKIDVKSLLKYKEDLIILSGCQASIFYQMYLKEGKQKESLKLLKLFKQHFKDFYLEIQPHTQGNQQKVNQFAYYVNKKIGIPLVLTLDSHYPTKEDAKAQYLLRKIKIADASLAQYQGMYLHDRKSAEKWWYKNYNFDCTEALNNTVKIAKMCNVKLDFGNLLDLKWPNNENRTKRLKRLAAIGLKRIGKFNDKVYRDQLKHEVAVVVHHGFEDVFLATEDVVNWANNHVTKDGCTIKTGPGRGSATGSLLSYCLGISKVDPLQNNLLFERFLRMDKKKMPDIDVDFDSRYRPEVYEYLNKTYPGCVANVISYGRYVVKNLMNDIVKVYNKDKERISVQEKNRVISLIQECIDTGVDFTKHKLLKKYKYVKYFDRMFKNIRYYGTHASGIAICKDMTKYIALVRKGDDFVTCYDLEDMEHPSLGILKMDVLGLRTLSVLSMIEQKTGAQWTDKCLTHPSVYSRFASIQDCNGIFQFNSRSSQNILSQVEPTNLEELTACSALNRPAPLKLGVLDDYVDAKNGLNDTSKPWYKNSADTYGCLIYQEQVMTTVRDLAGHDWQLADKVVKNLDERYKYFFDVREEFVKAISKHAGISEDEARSLHKQMVRYLFNKSHATAYTYLSCYQMWLMIKYPLESLWALMANSGNEDERYMFEKTAARKGIVILLAHVNGPVKHEIVDFEGSKAIQQGTSTIKGVGMATAEKIYQERMLNGDYKSVADIKRRFPKKIFRKNVEQALDNYGSLQFNEDFFLERCVNYNLSLQQY